MLADNPFETFGIAISAKIDQEYVESMYKALIQKLHPDRFANESNTLRQHMNEVCCKLNQHRHILLDHEQRLYSILVIKNIQLPNENQKFDDPEWLEIMMDCHEHSSKKEEYVKKIKDSLIEKFALALHADDHETMLECYQKISFLK
jgi:DnaJ-domain-containing protein 1